MYSELEDVAAQMAEQVTPDRSLMGAIEEIGFLSSTMNETDYAVRNWMLWYYFGWAYGEQLEYVTAYLFNPSPSDVDAPPPLH
jgi:hypothetical protein